MEAEKVADTAKTEADTAREKADKAKTEADKAKIAADKAKTEIKTLISQKLKNIANAPKNLTPLQLKNEFSFIKEFKEWEYGADHYISNPIKPGDFIWEDDNGKASWYRNETDQRIKTLNGDDDFFVAVGKNNNQDFTYEAGQIRELEKDEDADMQIITDFILSKISEHPLLQQTNKLIVHAEKEAAAATAKEEQLKKEAAAAEKEHRKELAKDKATNAKQLLAYVLALQEDNNKNLLEIYKALSSLTKPS